MFNEVWVRFCVIRLLLENKTMVATGLMSIGIRLIVIGEGGACMASRKMDV